MRKIISISETLEKGTGHVQANAEALYDETKGEMEVHLKITPLENDELSVEGFRPQTIKMKIGWEEAIPAAKDIFHGWVKRIVETGLVAVEK